MIDPKILLIRLKQVYLFRGIVNLTFGISAILLPNLTVQLLILLFGINSLFIALLAFRTALWNQIHKHSSLFYIIETFAALSVGVVSLSYPDVIAAFMVYVIATWSLVLGSLKIISAVGYKGDINGTLWLSIAGWVYVLLALYLFASPLNGIVAAMTIVGFASVLSGLSFFILSKKLQTISQVEVLIEQHKTEQE
jgi:uncharacterized membrane protein HdeD (DUF308 family)